MHCHREEREETRMQRRGGERGSTVRVMHQKDLQKKNCAPLAPAPLRRRRRPGGGDPAAAMAATAATAAAAARTRWVGGWVGLPRPPLSSPCRRLSPLMTHLPCEERGETQRHAQGRTHRCDHSGAHRAPSRLVVPPRPTPRPRYSRYRDASGRRSIRSPPGAGGVGLSSPSGRITVRIWED